LAAADVVKSPKIFAKSMINITQPFEGVAVSSAWFGVNYVIKNKNQTLGSIREISGFRLSREFAIDLPDSINASIQFFVFFLVCNNAYR
jgi:hypothetical protein